MDKMCTILMEWGIENNNWEMVHFLFIELHIGIPARLVYKLPAKNIRDISGNTNDNLISILTVFPKCKWTHLPEWNGSVGYHLPYR